MSLRKLSFSNVCIWFSTSINMFFFRSFFKIEIAARVSLLVLNSSQVMCVTLGLVGSLMLAAYQISSGSLNVGQLVAVQLYIAQIAAPLSWLGSAWEMINSAAIDGLKQQQKSHGRLF